MPRRHTLARKPVVKHYSLSERRQMRQRKRKHGPSAVRRADHRHEKLETLECGCVRERVRFVPCAVHAHPADAKPEAEPLLRQLFGK